MAIERRWRRKAASPVFRSVKNQLTKCISEFINPVGSALNSQFIFSSFVPSIFIVTGDVRDIHPASFMFLTEMETHCFGYTTYCSDFRLASYGHQNSTSHRFVFAQLVIVADRETYVKNESIALSTLVHASQKSQRTLIGCDL